MNQSLMAVTLAPFERRHSAQTLEWTNDPELSRLLGRPRVIDADEHEKWFQGLATRTDTLFRAIHVADRHVGNVWLAEIDRLHKKAETRVMIGAKDSLGAGVGSLALEAMARVAFGELGLHRVYAYVLSFNPRARRAFEKAGYVLEGTLREDRWDGTRYVDVWLLGRVHR